IHSLSTRNTFTPKHHQQPHHNDTCLPTAPSSSASHPPHFDDDDAAHPSLFLTPSPSPATPSGDDGAATQTEGEQPLLLVGTASHALPDARRSDGHRGGTQPLPRASRQLLPQVPHAPQHRTSW
ncbi:hypothetical protein T484DRAFT_1901587, partial [Baffinella frigidus]